VPVFWLTFINCWQADFVYNPDLLNQRQMRRLALTFFAVPLFDNGTLIYHSIDGKVSFESSSGVQSSGKQSSERRLRLQYVKEGGSLTGKMLVRPHYIPGLFPFQSKRTQVQGKFKEAEYEAEAVFSWTRLILRNPVTGKEVSFSRWPFIAHNPAAIPAEDMVQDRDRGERSMRRKKLLQVEDAFKRTPPAGDYHPIRNP